MNLNEFEELKKSYYIHHQGVDFNINLVRVLTENEKEKKSLLHPYKYYLVEFETGDDKIYPAAMNIRKSFHPIKYEYILCETQIKTK